MPAQFVDAIEISSGESSRYVFAIYADPSRHNRVGWVLGITDRTCDPYFPETVLKRMNFHTARFSTSCILQQC